MNEAGELTITAALVLYLYPRDIVTSTTTQNQITLVDLLDHHITQKG